MFRFPSLTKEPELDLIPILIVQNMYPDLDLEKVNLPWVIVNRRLGPPVKGLAIYATNFNPPLGCFRMKQSEVMRAYWDHVDQTSEDSIFGDELQETPFHTLLFACSLFVSLHAMCCTLAYTQYDAVFTMSTKHCFTPATTHHKVHGQ